VANEENILSYLTITVDPGIIGGMPLGGMDFGAAINGKAVSSMPDQFGFYDGGGLDLTCLGFAQCDSNAARHNTNDETRAKFDAKYLRRDLKANIFASRDEALKFLA